MLFRYRIRRRASAMAARVRTAAAPITIGNEDPGSDSVPVTPRSTLGVGVTSGALLGAAVTACATTLVLSLIHISEPTRPY